MSTQDLSDEQLLRYSRQIMLPQIDVEGQQRILGGRVLIIGLGGLGCPVAMYLAAAGVGTLELADFDEVDVTNLQRQIAHRNHSVGQSKVASAAATLAELNPDTVLIETNQRLEGAELFAAVSAADVVVDCTDNLSTRQQINRACIPQRTPLVSGAAIRMEGQITVFDSRQPNTPCYQCLYGSDRDENLTCSESGVLAPMVGIVGSMQALEALKLLAGAGDTLVGRLLLLDGLTMEWRSLKLKPKPDCPACSDGLK